MGPDSASTSGLGVFADSMVRMGALPFVGLDVIVYFGFFEEPEDALRAGFFEPVCRQSLD